MLSSLDKFPTLAALEVVILTTDGAASDENVSWISLHWRHNERHGVSNQRHIDCLLNRLFMRTHNKTSIPRVTGICEGNPPMIGGFPPQRASVAENVFIWWRHHDDISVSVLTSPLQTEHYAVSHFSNSYNIDIRISISQIWGYRSDQRQRK